MPELVQVQIHEKVFGGEAGKGLSLHRELNHGYKDKPGWDFRPRFLARYLNAVRADRTAV